MSSVRTIKLEFEYVSKPYVEPRNGAHCYEASVKPIGDHDFWAHIFKSLDAPVPVLKSLAKPNGDETDSMSIIAMNMKDAAIYAASERGVSVQFSEQATFHKEDGSKVEVKPAVFTPH